jgi:type II secretory pathway component GspD/PulD (secretin)/tetratricopeptide (TPR) repeat protein
MRIPKKSLLLLPALLAAACADMAENEVANSSPLVSTGDVVDLDNTVVYQEPGQEPGQIDPRGAYGDIEARKQKRRILAKNYLALADGFFNRGDYEGAAQHYADAFQLDPESRPARDGLRRAQAAMGGKSWSWQDAEGMVDQQALRWAATRLKVEGLMNDGDRAMARGDFADAESAYTTAMQTLRISPNVANDSLNTSLVQARMDASKEARYKQMEATRAAETAAAEADAAAQEASDREYFENRIRTLFGEANEAFANGFYDKAVSTLDKVLKLDPSNANARSLREVANEAWHMNRQQKTAKAFREEWEEAFQEMRTLAVPPKSSIEFDEDHWAKIQDRKPIDEIAVVDVEDPERLAIQRQLDSTMIEALFDNPVEEVADNLAAYTNVNFVISRAVREDMDEDAKQVNFSFNKPMPVSRIMKLIEQQSDNQLKFIIKNGAVNVVSAEESNSGHVLRQYEVRSIIRPLPDFDLPEITIAGSGGVEFEPEPINEDREANLLTEDSLLTILRVDEWEEPAYAQIQEGTLIVYHQPEEQDSISGVLKDLRKSTNTSVEISVRFMKVEDSFLQDIGIDFRGLGNDATQGLDGVGSSFTFDDFGDDPAATNIGGDSTAGVYFSEADDNLNLLGRTENLYDMGLGRTSDSTDDGVDATGGLSAQWTLLDDAEVQMILRAVEKSKRSEVVTEPSLMVYNATRATLTVANQVSYVSDFDVEIAQAASIAAPIVRVVMDGVFLDVTPVVSSDRRSVSIDLRPTVATLRRPIRTFQTSLGSGSPVTIMLPEIELQKIRTRTTVPDGGTVLVGGFKIIEQNEMNSGVPFLNRIPILSFFFQRQGTYESYRRLLILLTARIIIPDEHAPGQDAVASAN